MVTDRVTVGGAMYKGTVQSTYFEIQDGTWESTDTTIQYSSGVCMGWQGHPVKFHAIRLMAGPHPDSIIMSPSAADVVLRDSEFNISLAVSAKDGGRGRLDLPSNEPVSRVFGSENLPGIKYRLELVNTRVAPVVGVLQRHSARWRGDGNRAGTLPAPHSVDPRVQFAGTAAVARPLACSARDNHRPHHWQSHTQDDWAAREYLVLGTLSGRRRDRRDAQGPHEYLRTVPLRR